MSASLSPIRNLLIDLDGVLYRGHQVLPYAVKFIDFLRGRGIQFRLVSNNSTQTPPAYAQKLNDMGIPMRAEDVYTSALATAHYLRSHGYQDQSVFVVGEDGIVEALGQIGMRFESDHPDWVVVGLDRSVTYDKLTTAALAIEAGASFLATNADSSLPNERGLVPGSGAILAAITATTGKKPIVIGKPQPLMLELAMKELGGTISDTAMLGDRLNTDIQAGNALRMTTILVLTGVSKREDIVPSGIEPSVVVDNLDELMQQWGATAR